MPRFPLAPLFALLFAAFCGHAAGLPDTGQDTCYNDTTADGVAAASLQSVARDSGTHPRQDCRYGRDAAAAAGALTKAGAGSKGFDYTKIANDGGPLDADAALGPGASDWACTRDNITGLTWEVKTATFSDLRYTGHTYTWFNTNVSTNGGHAGFIGTDTCNATLPDGLCNTRKFVTAVNAAALCTYTDWRLPTRRELMTLVDAGGPTKSIDITYFPNTNALYWTGSTYAPVPANAWWVSFIDGKSDSDIKLSTFPVRLVRGDQF